MKRTLLTLTLAAALCLPALFAQKSAAEEPIVLTFNLGMPPIHQRWVNAIKPWCDELEKRSNGRIKIEPYFANALGKRSDAMDSVRTGIADLAEAPFSSNPGAFPFHSQIFSAANPSMALGNAYKMLLDFYKAHPEVLKKEIKGVKLMFIHAYPVGDCVMTKSAPILKLDDIKGKKLGFEGGGLRFETMQALGASVVGMNMSDLYQAMQGGIIDGIVMDFDPLISRRYGEEVKHVTLLNITGTAFYVVMNQDRYNSLPDDLKAIVDDMSQNYGPGLLETFWAENVYGSLDKWIKEMGGTVHVLSDEDYARADKLAAVPAQAWFKSLNKAGYRGAELEKTFHQLEDKYFTPWRQSEAYRYAKQQ